MDRDRYLAPSCTVLDHFVQRFLQDETFPWVKLIAALESSDQGRLARHFRPKNDYFDCVHLCLLNFPKFTHRLYIFVTRLCLFCSLFHSCWLCLNPILTLIFFYLFSYLFLLLLLGRQ